MKTASIQGIILGCKNIGEHDKFVFLYTKEFGKIKVVAKGSRRITSKFTGHLETLSICHASLYFGKNKIILREIISRNINNDSETNFNKASSAIQIAEITNQMLFENQKIEELFSLIQQTIQVLKQSERSLLIKITYIIKLLDKIGILPNHNEIETRLAMHYRNFFQYAKEKPLQEVERISLKNKEKAYLKNYLEQVLRNETQMHWQLLAH